MNKNAARAEWDSADTQNRVKLVNRAGISQGLVGFDWTRLSMATRAKIAAEIAKDETERQILRGERPRYEAAR